MLKSVWGRAPESSIPAVPSRGAVWTLSKSGLRRDPRELARCTSKNQQVRSTESPDHPTPAEKSREKAGRWEGVLEDKRHLERVELPLPLTPLPWELPWMLQSYATPYWPTHPPGKDLSSCEPLFWQVTRWVRTGSHSRANTPPGSHLRGIPEGSQTFSCVGSYKVPLRPSSLRRWSYTIPEDFKGVVLNPGCASVCFGKLLQHACHGCTPDRLHENILG